MAGKPGTPRFGEYDDAHQGKPGADGVNVLNLQVDESTFKEQHFLYNPSQRSRAMGSTLGDKPGEYYDYDPRRYEAPSNHDGFEGGDAHLANLDERKVLEDTIYGVPMLCADDFQRNWDSDERTA